MVIGSATITLRMFTPKSLKEKRQILKSIITRIKSQYNVSVAEISLNDKWQLSEIGMACVSNDTKVIYTTFNSIVKFIEQDGRVEIITINIEML